MLLQVHTPLGENHLVALLGGEKLREIEFEFGRILAWVGPGKNDGWCLNVVVRMNWPAFLEKVNSGLPGGKRFSYLDPYPYSSPALLAFALDRVLAFSTEMKSRKVPLSATIAVLPTDEHERGIEIPSALKPLKVGWEFERGKGREPAATFAKAIISAEDRVLPFLLGLQSRLARENLNLPFFVEGTPEQTGLEAGKFPSSPTVPQPVPAKRWVIYAPPGDLPSMETQDENLGLEDPREALNYFRVNGFDKAIVEVKHSGHRSVLVVCKNEKAAERRFGIRDGSLGTVYVKNGQPFFPQAADEDNFVAGVRKVLEADQFWERHGTDWACFDGEMRQWLPQRNKRIDESLRVMSQVASEVCAAIGEVALLVPAWHEWATWRVNVIERTAATLRALNGTSAESLFAPAALLATEGQTYFSKNNVWHLEELRRLCASKPFAATESHVVNLDKGKAVKNVCKWWNKLQGVEGIVVKPLELVPQGKRGACQPRLRCRTTDYLRLVYGSDYDWPDNLAVLRQGRISARRTKWQRVTRELQQSVQHLEEWMRS